jgi:putative spermidine/putrescine transport system substrate-binding protein
MLKWTSVSAAWAACFLVLTFAIASSKAQSLDELAAAAKTEGNIVSVGMPNDWANWGELWKVITARYGITHSDTDLSSAEMVAKFDAERNNATADIAEPSLEFARIAVKKGLSLPYKPTNWDKLPDWAKDANGGWEVIYTGTIAFLIRKDIKNPPKSFADLVNGDYKVSIGEVGKSAQANGGVLAAAVALGGGEDNLKPAFDLFAKLAEQKRLLAINPSTALMEKGEVEVGVVWDFAALGWRDIAGRDKWDVIIPSDGSVTNGYTVIINPFAKHPNAAKLTRDFALSDEGQALFANGYVRPIRFDQLNLPKETLDKMLPAQQYAKARVINFDHWSAAVKQLSSEWQEKVATKM